MKVFLIRCSKSIDAFTERIGSAVSWLTALLMIIICIDVIMRYLFSSTKTWVIELEWHIFSIIFLIGAAYTLLHDKHVRVDLFYEKYSERDKSITDIAGVLLFLVPWASVVIYYGVEYAMNSFSFKESSSQPNGLPARYIIKSFIALGFGLLVLQGLSELIRHSLGKKS